MRPLHLGVVVVVGIAACQHVPPRPLLPEKTAAVLESRTLDAPELAAFLEAALGRPPAAWPLHTWDLRTLTLAALYLQPSMDVARAHADVARAAVDTAGALPNPTLSVTPEYTTNVLGAPSPWLATVHLDWVLETAGKRAHRTARARADAESARAAIAAEAWRVRRELAGALATLGAARREEDAVADEIAADERLAALVEGRVREGAASTADAAPIRSALLQARAERAAVAASVDAALARVAAAVGVPARALADVTLPDGLDYAEAAALRAVDASTARRRALLGRADVLQAIASYAAAEATLALELARQYPDVHLGPGYQFDQGENKWSVGLAVDLPLLNRNEGPIGEAVAGRDEAAARVVAAQAQAIADVEQALARRAGETQRAASVRALAADRNRQLDRARAAFSAGATDRSTVVAADADRARARRATVQADASVAQALIDLDAAIAGPLPPVALERRGIAAIAKDTP